jgi:hypothetical protein
MRSDRTTFVLLLSLAAGLLDSTTGALLVTIPETTLRLFGATMPGGGGDILMRFVGAFVMGVGLSYLWGLATSRFDQRAQRLHGVWGATAAIRICIAAFTFTAVATRHLEPAWLVVGFSDATLALIQIWGLRSRWFAA